MVSLIQWHLFVLGIFGRHQLPVDFAGLVIIAALVFHAVFKMFRPGVDQQQTSCHAEALAADLQPPVITLIKGTLDIHLFI